MGRIENKLRLLLVCFESAGDRNIAALRSYTIISFKRYYDFVTPQLENLAWCLKEEVINDVKQLDHC